MTENRLRPATRLEVEHLKQSWLGDPTWDLDGFDDEDEGITFAPYHDELAAFEKEQRAKWQAQRLAEDARLLQEVNKLGMVGLYRRLLALEVENRRLREAFERFQDL